MKKLSYILFLFYAVFIISASAFGAAVKVDPESVNINDVGIGNTFNVNIAIENVSNLGGFEFELQYDQAVVSIENDSDVSIGDFLADTGRNVSPLKDSTPGLLKAGAFSYGDPSGPNGNGVLMQIKFTVKSLAESTLDLKNVILTDISAGSIAVDTITDGTISSAESLLIVSVSPASVNLTNIVAGNTFNADIMIQGVKNLGSFEFKLQYNPAIVKIAKDTDVTTGGFLESTGRQITLLGPNIDNDTGLLEAGAFTFGEEAGPNGSGVLMKIKFTVQAVTPGQLDLKDVIITDIAAVSIAIDTVKDGNLYIPSDDPIDDTTDDITYYADKDGDGTPDDIDKCPEDPKKVAEGTCGCGVADTDTDEDGTPDCNDKCPEDPDKIEEGKCGCGVADTDKDEDGTPDCKDKCPDDPNKIIEGDCGCGAADTDTDGDGTADCKDKCPNDPNKTEEGACGCGAADTDTDGDGTPDCNDLCPDDPENKCETIDTDGDGTIDINDGCPNDSAKTEPGACGCGTADTDTDGDGTPDCNDTCPDDPENKCDSDGDGTSDSADKCPNDPNKTAPGACGCGTADTDKDKDGTPDCNDICPDDPEDKCNDDDDDTCFINTIF